MNDLKPVVHTMLAEMMHVFFRQQDPAAVKVASEMLGIASAEFRQHYDPVVVPDGYDFLPMTDRGLSKSKTESWERSRSRNIGETVSREVSRGRSRGRKWSRRRSRGRQFGLSWDHREGRSFDESRGTDETITNGRSHEKGTSSGTSSGFTSTENDGWTETRGRDEGMSRVISETEHNPYKTKVGGKNFSESLSAGESGGTSWSNQDTSSTSENESDSVSRQIARGESESSREGSQVADSNGTRQGWSVDEGADIGGNEGESLSIGRGRSRNRSRGVTDGQGGSKGLTETVTHRLTPLARHKIFLWASGRLQISVADWISMLAHRLMTLQVAECLILDHTGKVRFMKVHHVPSLGCDSFKQACVEGFREYCLKTHPFYFIPNLRTRLWTGKLKNSNGHSNGDSGLLNGSSRLASSPIDRLLRGNSNNSKKNGEHDA